MKFNLTLACILTFSCAMPLGSLCVSCQLGLPSWTFWPIAIMWNLLTFLMLKWEVTRQVRRENRKVYGTFAVDPQVG